jgi:hypothetical protein
VTLNFPRCTELIPHGQGKPDMNTKQDRLCPDPSVTRCVSGLCHLRTLEFHLFLYKMIVLKLSVLSFSPLGERPHPQHGHHALCDQVPVLPPPTPLEFMSSFKASCYQPPHRSLGHTVPSAWNSGLLLSLHPIRG